MIDFIKLMIGFAVLLLGFPIGNIIARHTKEELKAGQKWFKLIIVISFFCVLISIIYLNDIALFTFLFIIIVTSRSLRK